MSTAGSCRECAHGNEGEKEGRSGRRRSKRMQERGGAKEKR
jgi:hypothetical protein